MDWSQSTHHGVRHATDIYKEANEPRYDKSDLKKSSIIISSEGPGQPAQFTVILQNELTDYFTH